MYKVKENTKESSNENSINYSSLANSLLFSNEINKNKSIYCKIHCEEIRWICLHKNLIDENFCEKNLLCIFCRKEHDKRHFEKIESIDFLKTDYLKKIIKKEADKIKNAKEMKIYLLELKEKINKLIDSKLESLSQINENYDINQCFENLDSINKKINNRKINEINLNDIKFFDETLNLIYSLKKEEDDLNNSKAKSAIYDGKMINNNFGNCNTPNNSNNSNTSNAFNNFTLNSPFKRSVSLINYNNILTNTLIKERKYSTGIVDDIKFNNSLEFEEINNNNNNNNSLHSNLTYNTNSVLDELLEKINLEFCYIKTKALSHFDFPIEKHLWDETILANNTKINKKANTITIEKSDIHNSAKSKQEFRSGSFSAKILVEEMFCCGGVGIGFDKFNPNGRRDVLFNNYIYFSDGKIAGNIKVENLPKFKQGDVIYMFCNIDTKEISFYLNSMFVYKIRNAEFKNEVYIIGDLDGGKLKFIY